MKIKSKLIATIVSMCAALAVMAVGVWAAATEFTLTISNSVKLQFEAAEVVIMGKAETSGLTLAGEDKIVNSKLFENGVYVAAPTEGTNAEAFQEAAANFQVVNDEDEKTTNTVATLNTPVTITYTYTITPTSTSSYSKDITIAVLEDSRPSAIVGGDDQLFTLTYKYIPYTLVGEVETAGAAVTLNHQSGESALIDFAGDTLGEKGEVVKVEVICELQYEGTTAAINVTDAWRYTITVANAA